MLCSAVGVWDISALAPLPHHHSGFLPTTLCPRCSSKGPPWPLFSSSCPLSACSPAACASLLRLGFTTLLSQCPLCHLGHKGTGKEQPQPLNKADSFCGNHLRADLSHQEDLRDDLIKGGTLVAVVHWGGHTSWKNLSHSCLDLCTSW